MFGTRFDVGAAQPPVIEELTVRQHPIRPATTGNSENFVPDSILIIYASASIRNNQLTAMIANHIFFASFFLLFFSK